MLLPRHTFTILHSWPVLGWHVTKSKTSEPGSSPSCTSTHLEWLHWSPWSFSGVKGGAGVRLRTSILPTIGSCPAPATLTSATPSSANGTFVSKSCELRTYLMTSLMTSSFIMLVLHRDAKKRQLFWLLQNWRKREKIKQSIFQKTECMQRSELKATQIQRKWSFRKNQSICQDRKE